MGRNAKFIYIDRFSYKALLFLFTCNKIMANKDKWKRNLLCQTQLKRQGQR